MTKIYDIVDTKMMRIYKKVANCNRKGEKL